MRFSNHLSRPCRKERIRVSEWSCKELVGFWARHGSKNFPSRCIYRELLARLTDHDAGQLMLSPTYLSVFIYQYNLSHLTRFHLFFSWLGSAADHRVHTPIPTPFPPARGVHTVAELFIALRFHLQTIQYNMRKYVNAGLDSLMPDRIRDGLHLTFRCLVGRRIIGGQNPSLVRGPPSPATCYYFFNSTSNPRVSMFLRSLKDI